jgi:hypothetical protein
VGAIEQYLLHNRQNIDQKGVLARLRTLTWTNDWNILLPTDDLFLSYASRNCRAVSTG